MNHFKCLILLSFMLISSCCGSEPNDNKKIETALLLSGTNRSQLEKVIEYYSADKKDSLKLKAAEFLISNMLYHRSMCGEWIENYIKVADTLYGQIPLSARTVFYMIPSRLDSRKNYVETEADIEKITADFLIKNIEYSFDIWENSIYEPKISFEDFCEYILPYKHSYEPLILWKDSISSDNSISRDFNSYLLTMTMANAYHSYKTLSQYYIIYLKYFKDKANYQKGDNLRYRAYMDLAFMRSKGIPTAIDFIPFTNSDENNYWVATINRKYIENNDAFTNVSFLSKVFRKTYSLNPTPNDKDNFVPDFISNPYNKDVTNIYQNTSTIEYDFGNVSSGVKYAYLAVFYDGEWCEVSWSELKDGKASFRNMGHDVIYMPIYYNGKDKICAKSVILLDRNGKLSKIGIMDDKKQSIALERVSSYNILGEYISKDILGAKIMACDIPNNLKFDTLATISHTKYNKFDTVNVNSDMKYKCWLYVANNYSYLSELQFFDTIGQQVQGQVFWIDRENNISYERSVFNNFFDNNIMTFAATNGVVGLLLEKPTAISYVKYMPQNDGCGIAPNNEYELFYFHNGKWILFDKKVATDYKIEFYDVPSNALLWLHDKGKKCNERPFTIVNGKIRFW